jgi:hypothetical protein
MSKLVCLLASLWAGVVLGGSLIAAPAKFQAPSLSFPVALEVGRAQFFWMGIAEFFFAACLILLLLYPPVRARIALLSRGFILFAVAAVIVQRGFVMPPLDGRTQSIIAGEAVGPSQLHLVFIALEIIKISLLLASCVSLKFKEKSYAAS